MIFFLKIGIFLKTLNHADIGVTIFVGAAACAKLLAVAAFGGGVQHCSTGTKVRDHVIAYCTKVGTDL